MSCIRLAYQLPIVRQLVNSNAGATWRGVSQYSSSQAQNQEPGPSKDSNVPSTSSSSDAVENVDEWTEVVHQESGQAYYWNQKTGQTTALGEPRPTKRIFSDEQGNTGGQQQKEQQQGSSSSAGAEHFDPRAEAPLPDKTGTYGAIGAVMGVFLGWASQFF